MRPNPNYHPDSLKFILSKRKAAMASKSEKLYHEHHAEFEAWYTSIHPEHQFNFEWVYVHDSGWFKEDMVNGAWVVWLALTGKGCPPRTNDTIESLATDIQRHNEAGLALTKRANTVLIPYANKLISNAKLDELKTMVSTFPPCPTRMVLAGKIALEERYISTKT